ncbi:hypothetical protein PMZ80_007279 [Knufia obscura]|uniref:Uncharacterized protein n=2 Tax=Knufia TaxID=430999 RepID=A0AAN8F8J2_9EURO|nr:hypothetical protein PMZ80_007279 [Knufia obscura]KAK5953291.1 hypothetical protein OHC33_005859 [Knufia fluminis]
METATAVQFPKIAIRFCVQCKWNLRAAYFAQELLQTFSNTIGEVSLIPVTGGVFTITLYTNSSGSEKAQPTISETLIWDRKRDGGFPETKELKNRIRNVIDPERDMGHVDRALKKGKQEPEAQVADLTPSAKQNQPENSKAATDESSKQTDHSAHKATEAAPQDCEECREAAGEDASNARS